MVRPFLSPADAAQIETLRKQGYATVRQFWHDEYVIKRTERPEGWDDGTAAETEPSVEAGVGRLYENGPGGEVADDVTIIGMSPYRFRLDAATVLTDNDVLIVNGREFLVQSVTRGDKGDEIAEAFLQERHTEGGV